MLTVYRKFGLVEPMLATAAERLPTGAGWVYEFKWDGVRALLDVSGDRVRITSRNGRDVSTAYPELVALAAGAEDALLDGEIVAFTEGRPSFELLQTRMHVRSIAEARRLAGTTPVTYIAFDLLRRFGVDLTDRPYSQRRATLERWLADAPGWTLSPPFDDAAATESVARQQGLEGVVAKRASSRYRPGVRSEDWRKLRFSRSGDFVVLGWEAPVARPTVPSSLLVARWRDGAPHFAGKVGSGLSAAQVRTLQREFVDREEPADEALRILPRSPGRVTRWVEPSVVVEIEFTAWTGEGRLRHPVFRGIRSDKGPDEAVGDG
jgi:bifunctional non-homologous end joining protein LigD